MYFTDIFLLFLTQHSRQLGTLLQASPAGVALGGESAVRFLGSGGAALSVGQDEENDSRV